MDIRRSTDLMLKATDDTGFAAFLTRLILEMNSRIQSNYGVVEKFTGDGILAFFPLEFTGPDAIVHALQAADECRKTFWRNYDASRDAFTVVIEETGLGIGLDMGKIILTTINGDITIVGKPVVYACRIATSGHTEIYVNQTVKRMTPEKYRDILEYEKASIPSKHDGRITVYKPVGDISKIAPARPHWDSWQDGK
jgi:adenylate cyclase